MKHSGENIQKQYKTRTFSLPANACKILHDLEILHVQSKERFTEISTQLPFGHPANTNYPSTMGKICIRSL